MYESLIVLIASRNHAGVELNGERVNELNNSAPITFVKVVMYVHSFSGHPN